MYFCNPNCINMKKFFLLSFVLFLAFMTNANPVGIDTAKGIGAKYLSASVGMKATAGDLQLVKTYYMDNGEAAFYVFNANKGFVMVAAQDVATPILGYSDEGTFDANNIPENMQWWLGDYAKQIQYGVEENKVDFEKTAKQWDLVKQTGRLSENRGERTVVGPLLVDDVTGAEILWNQSAIYSTQTPQIPNSDNHFAAGCVPVSMSQIMRKWKHPAQGTGIHTSEGSHHETIDFGATTYDWANMPVSLNSEILGRTPTSDEITAVGTLLHHAGVSVDCFYKLSGTDAQSDKVPIALVTYFGYSDEAYLDRLTHRADSIAIWKVKLRSSLNHGYPMYYSGIDHGTLGHAFACDGYDDQDKFHINWGYDGNKNGFYAIGALNYGGNANYNACNDAIFNIHPAGYSTYFDISVTTNNETYGTVTTSSTSVIYGGNVTVTATPKSGYCFCYWSLDGVNVSENAEYTFNVKYDRDLVAVFSAPYTITTASANDEQGTASGDGDNINYGEMHSITATPKNGYIFVNWTKGGEIVSSHNPYTFKVVEDGDYVANFIVNEGMTIGTGDTYDTQFYPFGKSYKYYLTEQIFTADEINCRGTIQRVAFFATDAITRSLDIYMTTTEKTAFSSKSDWVSVTSSNLVYSGAVSFANSNWTFIELDKSFDYDGVNNLVILIDDNSGTNPSITSFKAFDGSAQQAMMYRSDSNADPINITFDASYIGTYDGYTTKLNRKNVIILDIIPDASTTYSVTATVEPAGTGFVEGAGDFIFGELCTLTAEPNEQYAFKNWTRNGVQVSTDETYSFNVKEPHDLVANFYSVKPIQFMDSEVETICVEHWDTNGDGCLSNAEAAAVSDLGTYFSANTTITAFDELSYFTGLITIPNNAFKNCTNLTRVVIPENVTTIGNYAFYGCSSLTGALIFPESLTSIGDESFHGCDSFTGLLIIPDEVSTIGGHAFEGCTGFTGSLVIPEKVTSIGISSFYGCIGFDGMLIVGSKVGSIGYNAFYGCSGFSSIVSKRTSVPSTSLTAFSGFITSIPVYVPNGTSETYSAAIGWSQFTNYKDQIKTSDWTTPTATDVISVDNIYELTTDVTARYIYFTADDKVLTVPDGKTLTVSDGIASTDASQLVINDGAQLIIPNGANVKATFNKTTEASTAKATNSWYAISSPVDNVEIASFVKGTHNVYRYDETETEWEEYRDSHNIYTTLDNGRGYLYRSTTADFAFAGDVNTDNYTYPLTYTASAGDLKGFHLIGNPYSHNIYKGENAAIANTYLEDGFYTLTAAGAWVAGTDNTTAIAPNQAALVQAKSSANAQNLTITHTTNQGPTAAKNGNSQITLAVDNDDYSDVAYVIFKEGHGLNKVEHRNAEIPMLYVKQNDEKFAIADIDDGVKTINLGFEAKTMGKYTLSVKAEGDFTYLHLIDKLTGNDVDLLIENEYTFIGAQGDNDDRFVVCFDKSEAPDGYNDSVFAWQNGNDIIVNGDGELQIFDLTGRMVMSMHMNDGQSISTSVLQNGVYIFRLVGNDVKTQKIIVR